MRRFPLFQIESIKDEYFCVTALFGLIQWGRSGEITVLRFGKRQLYKRVGSAWALFGVVR